MGADSLKIIPANPAADEIIYVIADFTIPACCSNKDSVTAKYSGSEISIKLYYSQQGKNSDKKMHVRDTLSIGKLERGDYSLNMNIICHGGNKSTTINIQNNIDILVTSQQSRLDNILQQPELSVYPNPCHDFVYIDYINSDRDENVVIQIIDICGQLVYNRTFEEEHPENIRQKVILSEIQRGIYFIKAKQGHHEITRKVVVK